MKERLGRLSSDPRREKNDRFPDWEETIENSEDAANYFQRINAQLARLGTSLHKGSKLLEVGSGKGELLKYMTAQDVDVTGVDARPRHEADLPVAVAKIEQLPFTDETFDFVLSSSVFDADVYKQDRNGMLGEINRVLKKDGLYIAVTDHSKKGCHRFRVSRPARHTANQHLPQEESLARHLAT